MSLTPVYDLSNLSLDDSPNQTSGPLSADDFDILQKIGSGGYSLVHKAIYKPKGSFRAIKRMRRFTREESNALTIMNEANLLDEADHPNIIKFFGFYLTDEEIHLVLEFAPHGDLGHRLLDGRLSKNRAKHYVLQVADALEHLHEQQIIHRDVKALNVLLMDNNQIKLTDFGLATTLDSFGLAYGDVGTPYSRAPEVISQPSYSKNVDWWSLGVLLFELVTARQPFDEDDVDYHILHSEVVYPRRLTGECREAIISLLKKDPNQRINSLRQLTSTDFFLN